MSLIIGLIGGAALMSPLVFIAYKSKSNNSNSLVVREKKISNEVLSLFEQIKTMNPYSTNSGSIFDIGDKLIKATLYIRGTQNKEYWYEDTDFLSLLIEFHRNYINFLKQYQKDAHIEQFVKEGLVRSYQSFWINLEKQISSEQRIAYTKDMIQMFEDFKPRFESEINILIEDEEVRKNVVLHNQRIESTEVMGQIYEDSISHLRDKKRYAIAKTIHNTNSEIVNNSSSLEKDEPNKKKLDIDSIK